MELIRTKTIAAALGIDKKTVLEKARRAGWAYVEKSGGLQFVESRLPTDVRFALAAYKAGKPAQVSAKKEEMLPAEAESRALAGDLFLNAGDRAQEKAQYRAALIYEYNASGMNVHDFCASYNAGVLSAPLYSRLGEVSQTTFYRWLSAWKKAGASGVVPKYGMSRGGAGESLSKEERELLQHFYLRNTQPSARHAWLLMRENLPYSRCTYQTALRYLNSIPKMIAGYWRQGAGRFENLFLPHMEQNIEQYKSLEVVVSDHHCLDCVVMYKGKLVRPWITTFQDLRSGKVLGWCPTVKPSSFSIVVAYYMCCIRYGIPVCVLFDNGKDYHSKWLTGHTETARTFTPEEIEEEQEIEFKGLFQIVGSDVRFTRTYNGKSKARQERYFRIIGEYLAKEMGSYVGSDTRTRPDDAQLMWRSINGMEKRNDIPSWEDFVQASYAMIEYINDRLPCTSECMHGKTRSAVFAECMPNDVRQADKNLLRKALLKGQVRRVGRNGVKVGGTNYYSTELAAGWSKSDVRVYADLSDPERVMCCTLQGAFICYAQANYFGETGELSADIARLTAERNTLTDWAILGSPQVSVAPEYERMIDVALRAYSADGSEGHIENVQHFLDYAPEAPAAPGTAEKPRLNGTETASNGRISTLKNPLYEDDESTSYAREA